tara:strand:+ start:400 stop:873 length:474 start_codon:yes stop_codon:yes gene_type:complete
MMEYRYAEPIKMHAGNTFRGTAIKWDDSTEPLEELNGYRETFAAGALSWNDHTAMYMGHRYEGQIPLARVGAATLSLRSTASGLEFEGKLPDWAGSISEALQRGDLSGAVSIGFMADENGSDWNNRIRLRTVQKAHLHHIAIVPQGAYPSAQGSLTR